MHVLLIALHIFLISTSWKNLLEDQDILSLVIVSFILMTCTFDQVVILQGEIRCLSLLGLKGLNPISDSIKLISSSDQCI